LFEQSKLFFIIGLGRSGTSLLQEVMNSFDGFCCFGEARDPKTGISFYSNIIKSKDFSYLENFIEKYWSKEFFVEKTPNAILCLNELQERYTNSNFIFLERNPKDVFLSQINYHSPGIKEQKRRSLQVKMGNMDEEDLNLNYEQFTAKLIFKRVSAQAKSKSIFKNQLTIKYENFITDINSNLDSFAKTFGIKPNLELAKKLLSRPSYSSTSNKYEINTITDPDAKNMLKEACSLWNYEFSD